MLSSLKIGTSVSYAVMHKLENDLAIEFIQNSLPMWLVSRDFFDSIDTVGIDAVETLPDGKLVFSILNNYIVFEEIPVTGVHNDDLMLFLCNNPNLLDSYAYAPDYFTNIKE